VIKVDQVANTGSNGNTGSNKRNLLLFQRHDKIG
jgi:hypothetical protein